MPYPFGHGEISVRVDRSLWFGETDDISSVLFDLSAGRWGDRRELNSRLWSHNPAPELTRLRPQSGRRDSNPRYTSTQSSCNCRYATPRNCHIRVDEAVCVVCIKCAVCYPVTPLPHSRGRQDSNLHYFCLLASRDGCDSELGWYRTNSSCFSDRRFYLVSF